MIVMEVARSNIRVWYFNGYVRNTNASAAIACD